jgi:fructose-1,6-bisphosphatase/inositol monophosphatase family enzyme
MLYTGGSDGVGDARMTPDQMLEVLDEAADEVAVVLAATGDWGPSGLKVDQYHSDLAADAAALAVLRRAGLGVVSEESGVTDPAAPVWVALDPLDGSTNAHRRVPWYATSLCAVDADGPLAAVVVNLASGVRFRATRGGGAFRDGTRLAVSGETELGESFVTLSGWPPEHLGWKQFRTMGAAALDLCAVGGGVFDAFVDCARDAHGVWDYLAGALVCTEAGGHVVDAFGRDLAVREHGARRTPVGGASVALVEALVARRRAIDDRLEPIDR